MRSLGDAGSVSDGLSDDFPSLFTKARIATLKFQPNTIILLLLLGKANK